MTHTLEARQRNDRDPANNERKIEVLEARREEIDAELADLRVEEKALLAMAAALRDGK